MNTQIGRFSIALASAFLLGLVGCGIAGPGGPDGPLPGPTPPAQQAEYPPVVGFDIFDPQTEEELRGAIREGSLAGNPMVNYGYLIAKARRDFDPTKFGRYGLEVKGTMTVGGAKYYYLHKAPDADGNADLVNTMNKVRQELGGVLYIEPEIAHYLTADPVPFNWDYPDTYVASQQQYGVLVTQTMKAWQAYGFGPHRAVVCDIDTGIRYNHEDLTNVVRHAYSWFGADGNSGGNGSQQADPEPLDFRSDYPDSSYGTDSNSNWYHGTHTAGTMAAEGGNGRGVAGMCWNVDMIHYKGFSNSGGGTSWGLYGSLWHLAKWKKANGYPYTIPVNMSFGGVAPSQFNSDMIEVGLQNGIMCVSSAGNDGAGFPSWPADYTGVMKVGASDYRDLRVSWSNWGPAMSVMAPGQGVYSTGGASNSAVITMDGTSMASPHVAGLIGYMLTFAPDLKPDQIRTYIEKNADPMYGQTGHSIHTGWGRINSYRTIGAVLADRSAGSPPATNYSPNSLKVVVQTPANQPLNGALVYLYNSTPDGAITNYASLTHSGDTYVDMRNDLELEPEPGVAWFGTVKPGWYKAVAVSNILDPGAGTSSRMAASTPPFEVRAGVTLQPQVAKFAFAPLIIQTFATSDPASQATDTVIQIYNSLTGSALATYDQGLLDTYTCKMPTVTGTYWIRIYPYQGKYGEYALWLSSGTMKTPPAPGSYGSPGPDGIWGGETDTRSEDSQLIAIDDRIIYGDLTSGTGHYYRFVIP